MAGLRDIKRRIKSIQGTRKITRAMQMVSAAKMRKAQQATLSSRKYSQLAWELILNLAQGKETRASLLRSHPKAGKMAIILLTSNRGQVGSLNLNLVKTLQDIIKQEGLETDIVTYGKKGREAAVRNAYQVLADFEKFDRSFEPQEIYPLAKLASSLYKSGEYKKILLVYNHFISTLIQKSTVKQLLPFAKSIAVKRKSDLEVRNETGTGYNYLFEPNPKQVLQHLLPRIIESQIYQAILESEASEQSARMIMMKNATEAAGDLITGLTLTYNKIRQNKITTELAEITAGKIALE